MTRPRVVLLRGHSLNAWDLRPWEDLVDRFDVTCLQTGSNQFEVRPSNIRVVRVRALRDLLPPGRIGDVGATALGDRYAPLARHVAGADIVHSAEIGVWFSHQAAKLKQRYGFKLVLTVWETIPLHRTYRGPRGRRYRDATLPEVDLFLVPTARARACLLLEGVPDDLIRIVRPGVDPGTFAGRGARDPALVVSPGRLVWEKGHQDVIRAIAALRHGVVAGSPRRLLIVGKGPERERLLSYADDLGIGDLVEIRSVPYEQMPGVYAAASRVVLASLSTPFWEEQFGYVLAEALASGAPIVATTCGAIPEVVGEEARLVPAGDWEGLAEAISRPQPPPREARRFDQSEAAESLAAAYRLLLH